MTRREPSPFRCPSPFPTRKSQGEWVEMVFMVKAASLGLAVSQPFGDSQPYDVIITTRTGRTVRVQLKSAWRKIDGRYHARMWKCGRAYHSWEVQFFVVYIPPEDAWYVIPFRRVHQKMLRFYPHHAEGRGRYEEYRDAWRLITGDPADDHRGLGFTIHAAADPACL